MRRRRARQAHFSFTGGVMRRAIVIAIAAALMGFALSSSPPSAQSQMMTGSLEQGRYIANRVGMCSDCHGADFHGAMLPFAPLPQVKMPFASHAPRIAGLRMFKTNAQAVRFLQT